MDVLLDDARGDGRVRAIHFRDAPDAIGEASRERLVGAPTAADPGAAVRAVVVGRAGPGGRDTRAEEHRDLHSVTLETP